MGSYVIHLVGLVAALVMVDAYPGYMKNIPNGGNVTDPNGAEAHGVGHIAIGGGGKRNCFGKDYGRLKGVWKNLCPLDSDGDGLSNGEELGDPGCSWQKGDKDPVVDKISHPGICTPVMSTRCKHYNAEDSKCKYTAPITTTPGSGRCLLGNTLAFTVIAFLSWVL